MSDTDERLWNLMVWKMPLTNKELWGDSGGGEPPPYLFFVFFLMMIAAAIFVFANLMWPVK